MSKYNSNKPKKPLIIYVTWEYVTSGVRKASTFAAVAGSVAAAVAFQWDFADVLRLLFTVLAAKTVDQVSTCGPSITFSKNILASHA